MSMNPNDAVKGACITILCILTIPSLVMSAYAVSELNSMLSVNSISSDLTSPSLSQSQSEFPLTSESAPRIYTCVHEDCSLDPNHTNVVYDPTDGGNFTQCFKNDNRPQIPQDFVKVSGKDYPKFSCAGYLEYQVSNQV